MLGISATDLCRIEVPVSRITELLNVRRAVIGNTALRPGRVFGTTGEFWLNLQELYELWQAICCGQENVAERTEHIDW